jgi:mono/diheme cytochrome c family protein
MSQLRFLLLITTVFTAPLVAAQQNGEQLYTQFCSACHAVDGKGANNGMFPPLAGSSWLQDNPKRAVAIVLFGLHGPIEVNGKTYNLEMPPQGAALTDNQIVSILNYINSSWGNKGETVPRDLIRVTRSEFASRTEPWTGPELLKLFPLPIQKTVLADLTSRVYKGQWNQIPDFDKIQAENIEEEHNGQISPSISGMDVHFGIVWEGNFMAPENGEYEFALDSDDGARITLNDQIVCEVKGNGPMNGSRAIKNKIILKEGKNSFRMDYFHGENPATIHGIGSRTNRHPSKTEARVFRLSRQMTKPRSIGISSRAPRPAASASASRADSISFTRRTISRRNLCGQVSSWTRAAIGPTAVKETNHRPE